MDFGASPARGWSRVRQDALARPEVLLLADGAGGETLAEVINRAGGAILREPRGPGTRVDLCVVDYWSCADVARTAFLRPEVYGIARTPVLAIEVTPGPSGRGATETPVPLVDQEVGFPKLEALLIEAHLYHRIRDWMMAETLTAGGDREYRAATPPFPLATRLQELEELAIRVAVHERGSSRGGAKVLGLLAQTIRAKRAKLGIGSPRATTTSSQMSGTD